MMLYCPFIGFKDVQFELNTDFQKFGYIYIPKQPYNDYMISQLGFYILFVHVLPL
jgi:hypothetical protein